MAKKFESVLTIDDLAEYLKISKSTLYKLAQQSKVPGQKVGRHWRFHKEAIDRWLQNADNFEDGTNKTPRRKQKARRRARRG